MRELPPPRHEASDARPGWVAIGLLVMLPVLVGVGFLPWLLFPRVLEDQTLRSVPLFPEPRLQTDTAGDMARLRAGALAELEGVRWTDREAGLVHVPIGRAMGMVAARGIADWPAGGGR